MEGLAGGGAGDVVLGVVIADGYSHLSLAKARAELASLKRTVAERAASNAAVRDAALARLDADFAPTRTKAAYVAPQDEFTSDDAYAELKRRTEAGVAVLDRRHADDRRALAGRYAAELAANIRIPNRLQDALKERKYREEGAALDYLRYDANLNRLMAKVGQTEYWFALPNDKARELHARWISASVEGAAEDDPDRTRWLVDPASGGRYLGLPAKFWRQGNTPLRKKSPISRSRWRVSRGWTHRRA